MSTFQTVESWKQYIPDLTWMKEYIPENETLERMAKRIAKPLRGAREMVSSLSLPALPEKVPYQSHFPVLIKQD